MRKTRIFAALLCLMMIATAIPMMQASATGEVDAGLAAVLDGATEIGTVDFKSYYTNQGITPADGPMAGKWLLDGDKTTQGTADVVLADYTGADLYRLYQGAGGWAIQSNAINTTHVNNAEKARDLIYDQEYGYALGTSSPDKRTNAQMNLTQISADGLTVRAGTKGQFNTDDKFVGLTNGVNGWKWDNVATWNFTQTPSISSVKHYRKFQGNYAPKQGGMVVDMGNGGAMMVSVKLDRDGSTAMVILKDETNGTGGDFGFTVSNSGIVMNGASCYSYGDEKTTSTATGNSTAKYPLTTRVEYDILLKNNSGRYTIYARETEDGGAFTKVVSGSLVGRTGVGTNKQLILCSGWSQLPRIATKVVKFTDSTSNNTTYQYKDGTQREYKAADVAAWKVGDKPFGETSTLTIAAIEDGLTGGVHELSQATFSKVATYKETSNSGLSRADVLGANAVVLNKATFDAEAKTLNDHGKFNALVLNQESTSGTVNTDHIALDAKEEFVRAGWNMGESALLTDNMAVEFSFSLPSDATETGKMLVQAPLMAKDATTLTNRIYLTILPDGTFRDDAGFINQNIRNRNGVHTLLLVWRNGIMEHYLKIPGTEKYHFVGKNAVNNRTYSPAPINILAQTELTKEGSAWKIYGITQYALTGGVAEADTLPDNAAAMRQYVNENFADLNEANYIARSATLEDATAMGNVEAINNELVITNADAGNSAVSEFVARDASIPVGGYAEMKFKMQGYLYLTNAVNGKAFEIKLSAKDDSTYNSIALGDKISFEANKWFDLRILHNADGTYTVFVKHAEESVWNKLVENAAPLDSTYENRFWIRTTTFMQPFRTDNAHTKQLIKDFKVYGPDMLAGKVMMVLDGNQSTLAPVDGATIKYATKVVIAPDEVNDRKLIFAGYKGDQLLVAEPVDVPAGTDEVVEIPETLTSNQIDNIKVFLWDNFDSMTSKTPMRSFAK